MGANLINLITNFLKIVIFIRCVNNLDTFISVYSFTYPEDIMKYEGRECNTTGKILGSCEKVSNCTHAKELIDPKDLCSFKNDIPLYCCPYSVSRTKYQKVVGLRPVEQICESYYPRHKPQTFFYVGGKRTLPDEQPHMAAIGWSNSDGEIDWRCGGSLVTSNFILTAAHCTSNQGIPPNIARTGDLNLVITENNTFPENFNITQIFVHPKYRSDAVYHDIALLKISPHYNITFWHKPNCIFSKFDIPTTQLTGMGYGTRSFSGPLSNQLYQGNLKLQTHDECVRNVPNNPEMPDGVIREQLCAQDPKHVMDTCQGDSGGPLQFFNEVAGIWRRTIAGITSFGQYCAGRTPGVYTRVSEYIDWIEPILMSDYHEVSDLDPFA